MKIKTKIPNDKIPDDDCILIPKTVWNEIGLLIKEQKIANQELKEIIK